jgi:alpha-N-arabinofuranosidase
MDPNQVQATVYIDPHRKTQAYNRMIFGQFLEHFHRQVYGGVFEPGSHLSDERGFRKDVIEALRELRVPVVRWPGGCFVSAYHWKDGVGPDRRPSYDKAWRVEESNSFGTDEFIEWCRLIGSEPYICTNAGTGTPEEMSDWVEYCNLQSQGAWAKMRQDNGYQLPHNVHFWSIGNENYGAWEMGAKTAQEWGRFVTESAKMMKRADPSIQLLAAALADLDWTFNLLRNAGSFLDYVSIHGYYDPLWQKDEPSSYEQCIIRSGQVEEAIRMTEHVIAVAGYEGKIGIAFDEWNLRGWHHPDGNSPEAIAARDRNDRNATYSMADAIFSAGFFNTCLRHADTVKMANMAPVVNARGPLYVYPGGIVKRPSFHVLSMYANLLSENVADAYVLSDSYTYQGQSIPALDALVTGGQQGWRLALVNRDPVHSLECMVVLSGRVLDGKYPVTLLTGDSPDAYNDIGSPDRVIPVKSRLAFSQGVCHLPPYSLVILEIHEK